ncbi:Na(+)/H(+) antiporter subunit F [Paraliobacillus ryukyuensis]|uniref:Multisubunit sodium/proton antiporter MrpF subunit n=1 Tax=Paraliobacillus ryukyuensis TaxID=200904 RepID=A0A366DWW3_9BACI|nr:Na(+)/H(+) antiporter subunit F1 [Paraliobacillus ryukyuensis]RBO94601.1 multisubunit sodium/proton antiporter MrpF subunit [Paraliobacillus ryukyuensis]
MLHSVAFIVMCILAIAIALCLFRMVKGPSMFDRIVALDLLGITLIGFVGMLMIVQQTLVYVEVILVLGILSFVGTVALSKYMEGGVVIERDRD